MSAWFRHAVWCVLFTGNPCSGFLLFWGGTYQPLPSGVFSLQGINFDCNQHMGGEWGMIRYGSRAHGDIGWMGPMGVWKLRTARGACGMVVRWIPMEGSVVVLIVCFRRDFPFQTDGKGMFMCRLYFEWRILIYLDTFWQVFGHTWTYLAAHSLLWGSRF